MIEPEFLSAPPQSRVHAIFFDFDGTLSLLRGGWATIMRGQMIDELRRHHDPTTDGLLNARLRAGILANNGRPTIWQMRFLSDEIRKLGATSREPEEYLADFLDRLLRVVGERRECLASGAAPEGYTVPGSLAFLAGLRQRGIPLVLASGTDLRHVESEAVLLGVAAFFEGRLFAPRDEDPHFTKRAVIENFLAHSGLSGSSIVGFGDGAIETAEIKRVGGTAIAVACDEENIGELDREKRAVLVDAGADVVIADYRGVEKVLSWLGL